MNESVKLRVAKLIINDYIESGNVKPGGKLPTVRELKQIYKTSDTTVQHALSILEMWGMVKKKHGSGCYLTDSENGRTIPSRPLQKIIGCISSFRNDIAMMMYEGIDKTCRKNGFSMIVANTEDSYETEQFEVKHMFDIGCQAVVLYPVPRTSEEMDNDYLKSQYNDSPIVLIDNAFPEQGISQVVFDNRQACYDITKSLIKDGHTRIAFMMQDRRLMVRSVQDRYSGFIEALKEHNIEFKSDDLWVLSSDKSIYSASQDDVQEKLRTKISEWKLAKDHPTAAIAVEDKTAIYTISIAQELGICIPKQLTVVGFDNLNVSRLFKPAFSTTSPDFVRAGAIAAEMAIERASYNSKVKPPVYMNTLPVPVKWRRTAII